MNRLTAALLCCLMLAAAPLAWAQGTRSGYKAPPLSKEEIADKDKKQKSKIGDCTRKTRTDGIQPSNPDFDRIMANCLKG